MLPFRLWISVNTVNGGHQPNTECCDKCAGKRKLKAFVVVVAAATDHHCAMMNCIFSAVCMLVIAWKNAVQVKIQIKDHLSSVIDECSTRMCSGVSLESIVVAKMIVNDKIRLRSRCRTVNVCSWMKALRVFFGLLLIQVDISPTQVEMASCSGATPSVWQEPYTCVSSA